jgi:methyl acetate hydrolase
MRFVTSLRSTKRAARTVFHHAACERNATTDTVFAIFSTTKAITATACLQLVEEGKLDL